MEKLDKRYETKVRKEGGAVMAKKIRRQGVPSDAPRWAINEAGKN